MNFPSFSLSIVSWHMLEPIQGIVPFSQYAFSPVAGVPPLATLNCSPIVDALHLETSVIGSPNISTNRALTSSSSFWSCCWRALIMPVTSSNTLVILFCSSIEGQSTSTAFKSVMFARGIFAPLVFSFIYVTKRGDRRKYVRYSLVKTFASGHKGSISEVAYPGFSGITTLFR